MPIEIQVESTFRAPLEVAFAYTADYRNVPDWLYGISKFEPVGDKDYGLGAVFDGSMNLGATLHSRIEVNEFEENRLIGFDSIKGFKNSSRWTFSALDAKHSTVVADVSYELPGGIAGKALGKVIEPFVKIAVKHSSAALQKAVEAQAAR
jgi:uncharacterized membrane protein